MKKLELIGKDAAAIYINLIRRRLKFILLIDLK